MVVQPGWHERTSYLLAAIGAHTQIRFAEQLAPMGLQPQHFGVLRRVLCHEGSRQQDVADALRVGRGVMVGIVDELEAKGLLERRRHPVDRRANVLQLTAAGRHAFDRVVQIADALDEELIGAIPPEERAGLREHLQLLGVATGITDGVYPTSPGSPGKHHPRPTTD